MDIALAIFALILLFIIYRLYRQNQEQQQPKYTVKDAQILDIGPLLKLPYKKRNYLFTENERSTYEILRQIVKGQDCVVFPKVRLVDVIYIPVETAHRLSYWNKISCEHLDFVVCDSTHLRPLLVIELADSNTTAYKVTKDNFVQKSVEQAGVACLMIPTRGSFSFAELTDMVMEKLRPMLAEVVSDSAVDEEEFRPEEDNHRA
ncbi:MAG: DUF2726 domain-containing protein [Acidobacteriota bacterium]